MSDSNTIEKWMEYAKNDLLVARDLQLLKEYVYRAVLTHSQQSVEKYLKAVILKYELKAFKTHDLVILIKTCESVEKGLLIFENDVAWLSSVYIESRYPDDFEDIDKSDAERALKIAIKIEQFILKNLK
jgi:HEPN domain-containing protein